MPPLKDTNVLNQLLITGANGQLGSLCRERLRPLAKTVRLTDRAGLGEVAEHEEIVHCDLTDKDGLAMLVDGCDGIVHMGGRADEDRWEIIRDANIDGMFNLYEAARASSVTPRIVFASSNHAIGAYPVTDRLDATSLPRPDGLYGLSKAFGESLAQMYFDKYGIETASIRIGSCFPKPRNHRMLSTWLSHGDLISLIERIFLVPVLGCPIIYGVSANAASWWDNCGAAFLGWTPQDSADPYRAVIEATQPAPDPNETENRFQGGRLMTAGLLTDG